MPDGSDRVGTSDGELRYQADPDSAPSEAVVSALIELTDASAAETPADVTVLPPLYDAVNTDALDLLLDASQTDDSSNLSVTFDYFEYLVTVDSTGHVTVRKAP